MKKFLVALIFLLSLQVNAQHLVKGKVSVNYGKNHAGIRISEVGTRNKTISGIEGQFELTTTKDSTLLRFKMPGLFTETRIITSDTTLLVSIEIDYYNSRWLSFGLHHESINGVTGFQFSNGTDEEPFIHFESFQDNFLFKVYGQSDFNGSYSYGIETGATYLSFTGRTTLNYSRINFKGSDLILDDIGISSRVKYFTNIGLTLRTGFQKLNGQKKIGLGLGLERRLYPFHIALNSRYYFGYFHHQTLLQLKLSKKQSFTFRFLYERIDNYNLLNLGINYAFVRTRSYKD